MAGVLLVAVVAAEWSVRAAAGIGRDEAAVPKIAKGADLGTRPTPWLYRACPFLCHSTKMWSNCCERGQQRVAKKNRKTFLWLCRGHVRTMSIVVHIAFASHTHLELKRRDAEQHASSSRS